MTDDPPADVRGGPARYDLYDRFATVYDRHFGRFAVRVVPVLERLVFSHLPPGARVLDLCCGTGQLAAALTDRGFAVTGLDGSPGMLRIARRNAPAADFVLADARAFDLPAAFDAAVSTFDSINHVVDPTDLAAVFANVHRALRRGGRFAFDVNTDEGYRCRWWGAWHEDGCAIRTVRPFRTDSGHPPRRCCAPPSIGKTRATRLPACSSSSRHQRGMARRRSNTAR